MHPASADVETLVGETQRWMDRTATKMDDSKRRARTKATMGWRLVYWVLMVSFVLTAALNVLHVRAGFLTSYLADLTLPALLYVLSRGLAREGRRNRLMRWLGRTPERAASFFFLASTATEVSQIHWPQGIFRGRYDPWDIAAYGAGLLVCYCFDKWQEARILYRPDRLAARGDRHAHRQQAASDDEQLAG